MAISKKGGSLQYRALILDYLPSCSSSTKVTEEPKLKKLCGLAALREILKKPDYFFGSFGPLW
jgi:hypothetical protein